jgi:hypothetical protein
VKTGGKKEEKVLGVIEIFHERLIVELLKFSNSTRAIGAQRFLLPTKTHLSFL